MYPSYTFIYHSIPSYDGICEYMSGYQGVRIPDVTKLEITGTAAGPSSALAPSEPMMVRTGPAGLAGAGPGPGWPPETQADSDSAAVSAERPPGRGRRRWPARRRGA
jgi:hypothetical protein